MDVIETKLPGCKVLIPTRHSDHRGYFEESWNRDIFRQAGIDLTFVQENVSFSKRKGTVRGLHYQSPPHAQDKLVGVVAGSIIDVAVDVRLNSPTFGQWIAEHLSAENGRHLLVPKGFLHGFATCEDDVKVVYKCTDFYDQPSEGSVRFDDPELAIDWGLSEDAILSEKDKSAISFSEMVSPFLYRGS